jgi:hypothetical protein
MLYGTSNVYVDDDCAVNAGDDSLKSVAFNNVLVLRSFRAGGDGNGPATEPKSRCDFQQSWYAKTEDQCLDGRAERHIQSAPSDATPGRW